MNKHIEANSTGSLGMRVYMCERVLGGADLLRTDVDVTVDHIGAAFNLVVVLENFDGKLHFWLALVHVRQ